MTTFQVALLIGFIVGCFTTSIIIPVCMMFHKPKTNNFSDKVMAHRKMVERMGREMIDHD